MKEGYVREGNSNDSKNKIPWAGLYADAGFGLCQET